MTIRLTVDRERWWRHVTEVAATIDGLVPVVKGNGYGFGRANLAIAASRLNELVAVGTVHELDGLPAEVTTVVLTPTLTAPTSSDPVLTVGSHRHIEALAGWPGRVIVKLESAMLRYGGGIELVAEAQRAGLRTVGVAIHPPIAGTDDERLASIEAQLPAIDPSLDVWLSHLSPGAYESLPDSHRYKLRVGSYLWHGDREAIKLEADVLDTRPVAAGQRVGYHLVPVEHDGTLLMIGAGSAGGVAPLPDGRSPFHYGRIRLDLVEPPHMHTSMIVVPRGQSCPTTGDWVDLQRPLITTAADELRWI
ncbi:MAG: alanine racemase [Ilumatobacteraceae bacterium]